MPINTGFEREEIISRVKIRDVFDRLVGGEFNAAGFCRCPLHNEKTASFKLYEGNNSFYCYGCGQGGDVIKLYQLLKGIATYYKAMKEINEEFHLGVFRIKSPIQQAREATRRVLEKEAQAARIEKKRENYNTLTDYYKKLREMPLSASVAHDLAYLDRLLDQFGKWQNEPFEAMPDDFNAEALITALNSKYEEVI